MDIWRWMSERVASRDTRCIARASSARSCQREHERGHAA
jgi:hypothetical protein